MDHSSHSHHHEGASQPAVGAPPSNQAQPLEHQNHQDRSKHAGHQVADFKRRFFISLILTVPILVLSTVVQQFLNFKFNFPGDQIVLFLVASFIFIYGGWPFLQGAYREMARRSIGMMTLISLAISVAYFYSLAVTFGLVGMVFFWELATLIDIMLLGHWIEMKSVMGASRALEKLSQLIPDNAQVIRSGQVVTIKTSELKTDDIILVRPGDKIAADGVVIKGESFVNESMLTGEAKPVQKALGQKVIGGSLNEDGSLEIKVTGVGANSYLSKVVNLVKAAQASKSKTENLADRAAFWLTIIAIGVGLVTMVVWLIITKDIAFALERAATVLVIACPHALGLAIPLVVAISTTLAAQNGLLIRNRTAFENARKITTIVFDKTGTLTEGTFKVRDILSLDKNYPVEKLLQISASLERNSEHPIARAIVQAAESQKIKLINVEDFKALKGKGIEGVMEGEKVMAVSPGYLLELGLAIPERIKETDATLIFIVVEEAGQLNLAGSISLADVIRSESYEAIKILRQQKIKLWMLTGDNTKAAQAVADQLQLDGFFAGVLPHEKQEKIKELQAQGEFVAMVGDGINDAPALAQANIGIAIGSGTDVAAETADIILVNSNPKDIASLILFGQATYGKMVQNLVWATGYNIFAIPLAAGVLAGYGILLSPALGAVLMSLSTVVVAINAKLLRVKK